MSNPGPRPGVQTSLESARYQLAFSAYATAYLGAAHTPAFPGLTSAVLRDIFARMVLPETWRYWHTKGVCGWPLQEHCAKHDQAMCEINLIGGMGLCPDPVKWENVMYSAHLAQVSPAPPHPAPVPALRPTPAPPHPRSHPTLPPHVRRLVRCTRPSLATSLSAPKAGSSTRPPSSKLKSPTVRSPTTRRPALRALRRRRVRRHHPSSRPPAASMGLLVAVSMAASMAASMVASMVASMAAEGGRCAAKR